VIRFPITALSVIQSRRRQTAYDGLERLTLGQKAALGLDTGPAHLADDIADRIPYDQHDAQDTE
jgi:hypothetical protein|tara:strand:+ start:403 stop:594 length:192 start_codon:yes stop_codon:yes gene_type:complete